MILDYDNAFQYYYLANYFKHYYIEIPNLLEPQIQHADPF